MTCSSSLVSAESWLKLPLPVRDAGIATDCVFRLAINHYDRPIFGKVGFDILKEQVCLKCILEEFVLLIEIPNKD